MINNYIPINRKIFEHPFWCEDREFSRFEAWVDMIQLARFEDTKQKMIIGNKMVEWDRGQLPGSLRFLADRWKWSTKKVTNYLNLLISEGMINKETVKETGQTIVTICNYDKYNYTGEERKQQKKQDGNTEETGRKQGGNKTNKDNKEKNEEIKEYPPEILELNELCKKYFDEKYINSKSLECFDKLVRLDKYTIKQVQQAILNARNDSFWDSNFQSPIKLRERDKSGVLFIDRFLKINSHGANQKNLQPANFEVNKTSKIPTRHEY